MSVSKHGKTNQGKLISKQPEIQQCDTLFIDLIGKYQTTPKKGGIKYAIKDKKFKDINLQVITMVDLAITCGIEIRPISETRAYLVVSKMTREKVNKIQMSEQDSQ